jgi:hypothetical protein
MLRKKIKYGTLTLLVIAITACNSNVPNTEIQGQSSNKFAVKDLSLSYIERKLEKLILPGNGEKLVKELEYGSKKYPVLIRQLCQANHDIYDALILSEQVITRRSIDSQFDAFINSLNPAPSGEFQVNSYITGNQRYPAVAMDGAGDYVIVWTSYNQYGSGNGIFGQRYKSNGSRDGSEFQVNTFTGGYQRFPAVAMDQSGDFIVSWNGVGQESNGTYGISARIYDSNGVPLGSEFLVNSYTNNNQTFPSVGIDDAGDFVIAWQSYNQDGSRYGIFAKRYNAAGVAQGCSVSTPQCNTQTGEFRVNSFTGNHQGNPSVAMDNAGDFVVTWYSYQDGSNSGIMARRYDSTGAQLGSEFRVNTYTTGYQLQAAAAMDADGGFVIGWESWNQNGNPQGIFAQRFNADGSKPSVNGSEFQVNTFTSTDTFTKTAMDGDGDFIVIWTNIAGQDGSDYGIFAQRYDSSGATLGSEFQVNNHSTDKQGYPSVAMDAGGDFVIAWESRYQESDDISTGYGIFSRKYSRSGESQ